jgi:hypothetical protein
VQKQSSVASKLLRAVMVKSFLEVILGCVVATLAAFSTFSPQLRGAIDVADQTRVAGWVHDPQSPANALEVQLFIDGKFAATKLADEARNDLVEAGVTSQANHGFNFALEPLNLPDGEYSVQVYAVRAAGANKTLLPITTTSPTFRVSR